MRTWIRGFAVIAAAGLMASTSQSVFAQTKAENQLVGIKLWRTYRDVLAKYGQPTRIENGPVTGTTRGGGMPAGGPGGDMPTMGMGGGGLPGMSGMGMLGGGGMMGGPPGMGRGPGGGGSGGRGGGKMGGGPMMGMGMGGGSMGGGQMQRRGGPGGEDNPGGAPGFAGGLPGMSGFGALAGAGGPPGMMGGGAGGGATSEGEGEVTWVYERPGGLTYMFLFNKDGRVIQIQEFGYRGGQPTTRGVGLGDPVAKIYSVYGWAGSAVKDGTNLTLDYSNKQHVAFQLLASGKGAKVVGITVAITELGQAAGSQ